MTEEEKSVEEEVKDDGPAMLFYCKDCQSALTEPVKNPKKYEYKCPVCKGYRVSFGTKKAITDFFHIKDAMLAKMLAPKPEVK